MHNSQEVVGRKLLTCGAGSRCCRTYLISKRLAYPAQQIWLSKGIIGTCRNGEVHLLTWKCWGWAVACAM